MLEPWALGYKAPKKMAYLRIVERPLVLRGASFLQALNGTEAANIAALRLGPRVVVVPNGIGPGETFPPDPAEAAAFLDRFPALRGKTLILFLHRVDPKKGLDLLAPAYAAVRARFPQTHLVVAGPPAAGYEETARGFFRAAGVEQATTFTGMLHGTLKRGALAAARVFVAPTYSEGFSMAVLEAMAAGMPCVLTTGSNFPEAGTARAARVVPIEAEAIATALADTLADPAASRDMGARARALVLASYTWDRVAAQLEQLVWP
jgi:glycosyltransferase involved in cell wall biosynthesis